jgi:hypothetical protein
MAAATWCGGAYIPGMAGVSDLSRCAADPGLQRLEEDDLVWVNKAEDRGDLEGSRGLGVFCTEAAFLMPRWYADRAASEKLHPTRLRRRLGPMSQMGQYAKYSPE